MPLVYLADLWLLCAGSSNIQSRQLHGEEIISVTGIRDKRCYWNLVQLYILYLWWAASQKYDFTSEKSWTLKKVMPSFYIRPIKWKFLGVNEAKPL